MKVGVVVPSNRPERRDDWMAAWKSALWEDPSYRTTLYWIDDEKENWDRITDDLKKDAWIIPVKTDCIRSYGFLQAFRDGCDVTVTLDDDVSPMGNNPIKEHLDWLNTSVEPDRWVRTLRGENSPPTRGLPLSRHIVINHGLWTGVPDVSARTQLAGYRDDYQECDPINDQIIPTHRYYPMSGMNLAFDTRLTRFMYFTLQGWDIRNPLETTWGLNRCGDILAGVLSKTVIDNFDFAGVHSGRPYVHHERASDPQVNLGLEGNSYDVPQIVAQRLKGVTSYLGCAERLFGLHIEGVRKDYFRNLAQAMRVWYELCKGAPGEYTRPSRPPSSGPIQEPQDAIASREGLAESEVVP
jgi:hypothetical protein